MIPTKTRLPRRPARLLHRPCLIDRVHRHVDPALTMVSAPAGYGKTALLIDFAHDASFPVCWFSLDASDLAVVLNNVACARYYLTGEYSPALSYLEEALAVARQAGAPRAEAFAFLTMALHPSENLGAWAGFFGRRLLLPAPWIDGGDLLQVATVDRRFGVTEPLARQRLEELGIAWDGE